MALDPHLPVIVGTGQLVRRPESAAMASEPAAMMAEVARAAAEDAGSGGQRLMAGLQSIRVVESLSWRYRDPGRRVAEILGIEAPPESLVSATGGNSPQMFVTDTAAAIQRGELDAALVVGAEAMYTRFLVRKTKEWLDWATQGDDVPAARSVGDSRPGTNDAEMARSVAIPTQIYPLFENALRVARGEKLDEHQARVASLWSSFSEVAGNNPYAWDRESKTADQIATVSPNNRMIGFPYPKLMNANLQVDQAAAVLMSSLGAAREAGIADDRMVFVHSGGDAHDHWWVSSRADLSSSPAIRALGRSVLGLAGIDAADLGPVDLYSCFPSAVQIAAAELGLPTDDAARPLTVTGGLTFAGGPGNNYPAHAIATMVGRLRADPDGWGLVTGVGWYLTKHSAAIYSGRPPAAGFRSSGPGPQAEVDASPSRGFVADYDGPVTVETYTVMYERDGSPALGITACLLPDGRRAWGNVRDSDTLTDMCEREICGLPGTLGADGNLDLR